MAAAIQNPNIIRAEICKRSFYEFFLEFWSEISAEKLEDNWHIRFICDKMQTIAERVAEGLPCEKDLLINISPGTSKSSICSVTFIAWCWTKYPWMRFITASYSGDLALEQADKTRDIIKSDKWKRLYPHLRIKADKDAKGNFRIVERKWDNKSKKYLTILGGSRQSTSVGGTIIGKHAHILIVDDPLNVSDGLSEKEISTTNRWMNETLPTRKVNKETAETILIMQRIHENDPAGNWITNRPNAIEHIQLPCNNIEYIVIPEELNKYYDEEGLFDATRMPTRVLKRMEENMGQYGFAGQMGQNPVPPLGGMFKVDRFIEIHSLPENKMIVKSIRYWDKAGSTNTGCYTVGVLIHKLWDGRFVISDVVRGQWGALERENVILAVCKADADLGLSVVTWIEQEPGSGGKESAESTIRNLAGFVVFADIPKGRKELRADPLSVQVNNNNVQIVKGAWNKDFFNEYKFFPHSRYKDQVDAGAAGFNLMFEKREVQIIR